MATNESIVLDGLDLTTGSYGLRELTLPIPRKRPEWVEGVDADGALLMRDPLVSNAQCVARVDVTGSSRDNAHTLVGAIVDKLEEADREPGGIGLVWTPADSTKSLTFYVLSGEVTELPVTFESGYFANVISLQVTMDCRPGGYGAEISAGTATVSGPLSTLTLSGVLGDMPSDEARLVITDASSQSRRHVEWGMEQRYYNAGSPDSLIIDSDSMTTSGYAGTGSTQAGAYDPGAAGNSVVSLSLFPTLQAACAFTGAHVGTFRVKCRAYLNTLDPAQTKVRLSWRAGDATSWQANDFAAIPTGIGWNELDLGLVRIPPAAAGTQVWEGRLEASSLYYTEVIKFDYVLLVPAMEGYGRARAAYVPQPGLLVARDEFTGTTAAGVLNGRVAPSGGTWVTSGAATDFTFIDSTDMSASVEAISRSTINDAAGGRLAVLGATNYTDMAVGVHVYRDVNTIPQSGKEFRQGVIARYVDASNHLRLVLVRGSLAAVLRIEQVVGGTVTTLSSTSIAYSFTGPYAWRALRLTVSSSGRAVGTLHDITGVLLATVTVTSTVLATGGTLDDGKPGIYDENTDTAFLTERVYDNFVVEQIPAEPIALYSGRTLEVRSGTTIRQNSGGTSYGAPDYRGSRFVLQPAGTSSSVTRIVAKAHRNDAEAAVVDNITDQLTVQALYRPRYGVVPR